MSSSVEDRHRRILQIVREHGLIEVRELAERLGISMETIRRDIRTLTDAGRLQRRHGAVAWPTARLPATPGRAGTGRPPASGVLLGMVVPTTEYYYQEVIRGARAAAAAAGMRLLIAVTGYAADQDASSVRGLLEAGAQGLLVTPSWDMAGPTEAQWAATAEPGVPTVVVERPGAKGMYIEGVDEVYSDHHVGVALAVRHLTAQGHRRIALMCRMTHTAPRIIEGYRAAMRAAGLPQDLLVEGGRQQDPQTETAALLARREVRAAIVHSDADAFNVLHRLQAEGLAVPGDVALVSYDDEMAALADVPLTAVGPAKYEVGEMAVSAMLRRLAAPEASRLSIAVAPRLTVRDSSGSEPAPA
ncbi:DeoR/GlpR family transcriptional regulator [Actinospica durhamensis]|uniref:DeoR/GlpR family transcriptional regulator n=1 Tax=Actinospica durhamensis TaxID=1508375 RepID=A0A941IU57_9ACTN|nr:substrate-binding domain-containing protein [Actinospica durhamensis]MBR7836953.1 DeoR/GlpR family transcriptional regulator [Actinospica durhamensis]